MQYPNKTSCAELQCKGITYPGRGNMLSLLNDTSSTPDVDHAPLPVRREGVALSRSEIMQERFSLPLIKTSSNGGCEQDPSA